MVGSVRTELEGRFVEAGTQLAVIRHFLSKDEVIAAILQKVLFLFPAPERAKYYFIPSVDKKVKASGPRSVSVKPGMPGCGRQEKRPIGSSEGDSKGRSPLAAGGVPLRVVRSRGRSGRNGYNPPKG